MQQIIYSFRYHSISNSVYFSSGPTKLKRRHFFIFLHRGMWGKKKRIEGEERMLEKIGLLFCILVSFFSSKQPLNIQTVTPLKRGACLRTLLAIYLQKTVDANFKFALLSSSFSFFFSLFFFSFISLC